MEFPGLGKRCGLLECKQLDFLPFKCSHCEQVFCKDHFMPDKHMCTHGSVSVIEAGEPLKHYRCTHGDCSTSCSMEMCCKVCNKHFCLHHRHHGCNDTDQMTRDKERSKWEAPKRQFELAKAEADRQVDASLNRAKKKESLNKTALKVQLMRLKGKAAGSKGIPVSDRVYFLIYPPLTFAQKSKAVFVAKQWSIGRVIDSVADLCDIPNRNNQTTATKLRLFHHHDGQTLGTEMERKLDELLNEGTVMDGETLVLEYVNEKDHDSFCLKCLDHYKD